MLEPTNFTSAPFSSAGSASPGVGSAETASPASTARITSLLPFSSMISTSRPRFSQKPSLTPYTHLGRPEQQRDRRLRKLASKHGLIGVDVGTRRLVGGRGRGT